MVNLLDEISISMGYNELKYELVNGLLKVFDQQVYSIILYGSVAKGTNTAESDIDIAVILSDKMSAEEKDKLLDTVVDFDLTYDKVFSVINIRKTDYDEWRTYIPFYKECG